MTYDHTNIPTKISLGPVLLRGCTVQEDWRGRHGERSPCSFWGDARE